MMCWKRENATYLNLNPKPKPYTDTLHPEFGYQTMSDDVLEMQQPA